MHSGPYFVQDKFGGTACELCATPTKYGPECDQGRCHFVCSIRLPAIVHVVECLFYKKPDVVECLRGLLL